MSLYLFDKNDFMHFSENLDESKFLQCKEIPLTKKNNF